METAVLDRADVDFAATFGRKCPRCGPEPTHECRLVSGEPAIARHGTTAHLHRDRWGGARQLRVTGGAAGD
jgi:hypothetical protein